MGRESQTKTTKKGVLSLGCLLLVVVDYPRRGPPAGAKTVFQYLQLLKNGLLKKVQIQYCLGVSLSSFIRQAISIRDSWMSEVCERGRPCKPPEHWARNFLIEPPSDEEFPAEVAENFDEGQPWFDINTIH